MVFKDYYKILGFDTNKVTTDEIREAYREKAKKYHPDINVGNKHAEEIFKDVNEAYRILSNNKTRLKYDFNWLRYGKSHFKKSQNSSKGKMSIKDAILKIFFGDIKRNKKIKRNNDSEYGEDIVTNIEIPIEEAFFGAKKTIKLKSAKGADVSFTFKIPAGIRNNDKIRIVGQGKKGKNGGRDGDLLVYITIKNTNKIKLVGNDFQYELTLKPYEAALGTKKTIEFLGEEINVLIPEGTSSGDSLLIKGKGYRMTNGARGNLYILTKIVMPKKLSSKEIELYKQLAKVNNLNNNSINNIN